MGSSPRADGSLVSRAFRVPPPCPEIALELARRWRDEGDVEARNGLVRGHVRIPAVYATRYRRLGPPGADLFAEGCLGLLRAADRFDPDRGVRFATYAEYWVRSFVVKYTLRCRTMVPGSTALSCKIFFGVRREVARARAELGAGSDVSAVVAERLGIPAGRAARWIQRIEAHDVSLDAPLRSGSGRALLDGLVGAAPTAEVLCAEQERALRVAGTLQGLWDLLDAREHAIVLERLMADERTTLGELGARFGVTRQRMYQIEVQLVARLRAALGPAVDA